MEKYDLIIVGAGPAALTASIYASRYGVNHCIIGNMYGSLLAGAYKVHNFPTEMDITGMELIKKIEQNAKSYDVKIITQNVNSVISNNQEFEINDERGDKYLAKTIIFAMGTKHKHLNLPNEDKFLGKGVSYCATCDGPFYKGKVVAVIGIGNSANLAVTYLSNICEKVYQISKDKTWSGEEAWVKQIKKSSNVVSIFNNEVIELVGVNKLEKVRLKNKYNNDEYIKIDGVFIEIGTVPNMFLLNKIGISCDKDGFIVVNSDQSTNIKGIWAAGDITTGSNGFRQIITACSEGAIAALSVSKYLRK